MSIASLEQLRCLRGNAAKGVSRIELPMYKRARVPLHIGILELNKPFFGCAFSHQTITAANYARAWLTDLDC